MPESLKTSYPIGGAHRILTISVTERLELNSWNHQTLQCCLKNTDRLIEPYRRRGSRASLGSTSKTSNLIRELNCGSRLKHFSCEVGHADFDRLKRLFRD
ncbi:hypothetical protein OIU85_018329 [Salix viminalis]|uniref:Uncharacterized protein n=2 Tax=Salix TaxID=40685 RepID=A0A9Q0ZIQ5_SALVM|nr:hypothetical protein OIU84_005393 [Salix udensis]KAJ6736110.1 hypothetical protein OIU85_018329 [Salix viminalis]